MPQPPEKSRTAKVGSNVKAHKALVAYDARAMEARIKPLVQLHKATARARKAFLTKSVRRVADDVATSSRNTFNRALLKARGDGAAIVRARRKARTANNRALAEKIPGVAAFQAAQIADADEYQKLIAQQRAAAFDSHVDLGPGAVVSDTVDFQVFEATYPLHDVATPGVGGVVKVDGTFADPRLGIVLNQVRINWDSHEPLLAAGFDVLALLSSTAIGVDYTVPQSGRLSCSAVVQNIYNYVTFSLSDNWGFSDGEIHFRILLFIRIIRDSQVIAFDRLIFENGLIALDGTNMHGESFDDIEMSTPYTLSAKTAETFAAGERVQLLIGSRFEISGQLNDMQARVNGTIGWQVKSISARTRP